MIIVMVIDLMTVVVAKVHAEIAKVFVVAMVADLMVVVIIVYTAATFLLSSVGIVVSVAVHAIGLGV